MDRDPGSDVSGEGRQTSVGRKPDVVIRKGRVSKRLIGSFINLMTMSVHMYDLYCLGRVWAETWVEKRKGMGNDE